MDNIGFSEARFDIADVAVDLTGNVALRIDDAGLRTFVVNDRRARPHCLLGIEHRREQFVFDHELAAAGFSRRLGFGNDRRNTLADKADDRVEQGGVVRIAAFMLVSRRRIEFGRRVLKCQHHAHAWNRQRSVFVDRYDACVGVRRAQEFQMQHPGRAKSSV